MAEYYVGEIIMFAGTFTPQGFLPCDGSSQSISQYETLFSLIGTTYGGDGVNIFNLPDLRGRVAVGQGSGYQLAVQGGTEQVTISTQQLPAHNHGWIAADTPGDTSVPSNGVWLSSTGPSGALVNTYAPYDSNNQVTLAAASIGSSGGGQPHANMQPSLTIRFIISTDGVFPTQN